MQQVHSDRLEDFAAIYEAEVELVSIERPRAERCEQAARRLINTRQAPQLRWVQAVADTQAAEEALPGVIDSDIRTLLSEQVNQASEVLGELLDCERVGVRLETLAAPMCPRFHVDNVPCRMLITLSGVGTEWIASEHVNWAAFADLQQTEPPLQDEGRIQHLATGAWSLLKGGAWSDHYDGLVHRSPSEVGERLLLSLDPVF